MKIYIAIKSYPKKKIQWSVFIFFLSFINPKRRPFFQKAKKVILLNFVMKSEAIENVVKCCRKLFFWNKELINGFSIAHNISEVNFAIIYIIPIAWYLEISRSLLLFQDQALINAWSWNVRTWVIYIISRPTGVHLDIRAGPTIAVLLWTVPTISHY